MLFVHSNYKYEENAKPSQMHICLRRESISCKETNLENGTITKSYY